MKISTAKKLLNGFIWIVKIRRVGPTIGVLIVLPLRLIVNLRRRIFPSRYA